MPNSSRVSFNLEKYSRQTQRGRQPFIPMKKPIKLLLSLTIVSSASATLVITPISSVGPVLPYSAFASSTDLINAGQPTLSSATVSATFGSVFPGTGINDGNYTNTTTHNAFFRSGLDFPATATYDLNVGVNTFGYDITSINSFMGWQGASSMAQGNQTYTIAYSVVGSALYSALATVAYSPFTGNGSNYDSMVTVTDSGGVLASGVDSVRFTFADPGLGGGVSNPGTVVREIDVVGVASVPEPSVVAFGLGGLLLLSRRRRL